MGGSLRSRLTCRSATDTFFSFFTSFSNCLTKNRVFPDVACKLLTTGRMYPPCAARMFTQSSTRKFVLLSVWRIILTSVCTLWSSQTFKCSKLSALFPTKEQPNVLYLHLNSANAHVFACSFISPSLTTSLQRGFSQTAVPSSRAGSEIGSISVWVKGARHRGHLCCGCGCDCMLEPCVAALTRESRHSEQKTQPQVSFTGLQKNSMQIEQRLSCCFVLPSTFIFGRGAGCETRGSTMIAERLRGCRMA